MRIAFLIRLLLLTGLLGWPLGTSIAAEPLTIYTVNYPLQYFAQRIAGEHAKVVFPVPAGQDPGLWEPPVEIIADYQQSDLILLNGAGYAQWISKASLPRRRLVDTSKMFANQYITIENAMTHSHGPGGEHSHTDIASTTWLDFQQAALQAKAITEAFIAKRPDLKATFEVNFKLLEEDLMALDQQLQNLVAKQPAAPLLASHPVYQYLARRYQLNLKSMHWEPQEIPNKDQWTALESLLKEHPARWMLWEAQPAKQSAGRLAEMGIGSVVFDPCGNVPAQGDWLSVMQRNIENLKSSF